MIALCKKPVQRFFKVMLGALGAGAVAVSIAAELSPGDEKLRQLFQPMQPSAGVRQPGGGVQGKTEEVAADRLKERAELLQRGEAALSRLDVPVALQAFDRAALILHAADTEIALVRTYMQGGEYRRALAFGAHTAGAHLDVVGGAAVYAWLLHLGGQDVIAQRLLVDAERRMPGNRFLADVRTKLSSGAPLATGKLLSIPARLAPYGQSKSLPAAAKVLGSAMLMVNGKQALVPLALLPRSGRFWLRNGLGHLSSATLEKRLPDVGMALVRLKSELPGPESLWIARSTAFPGSVAYAIEYVTSPHADPAWPVLRSGFLGAVSDDSGTLKLGVAMPAGPRGGPVFNAAGHLIGVALPGKNEYFAQGNGNGKGHTQIGDRLIPMSVILAALGTAGEAGSIPQAVASAGSPPPPGAPPRTSADRIYELSLRTSLQLIAVP